MNLGNETIAKYPFLPEAGKYLASTGFNIESIGTNPNVKMFISNAYNRITSPVPIHWPEIEHNASVIINETMAFITSVLLLKLSGMQTLINRFALKEAKRAEYYLRRDLMDRNESTLDMINNIFSPNFTYRMEDIKKKGPVYQIPIPLYIRQSAQFRDKYWKIINQNVANGYVYVESNRMARLMRDSISRYIISSIKKAPMPQMYELFDEPVQNLISYAKQYYPEREIKAPSDWPPCIKHAINELKEGSNLPHSGRFMLATYMLKVGKSIEEITSYFVNAPDYDERITKNQIESLLDNENEIKYSCPSCTELTTRGLCHATADCEGIVHPLQFGRKKKPKPE